MLIIVGHLPLAEITIVEYDGTDATNTWALVKNADDEYYYEYVYMENISIPVVKL